MNENSQQNIPWFKMEMQIETLEEAKADLANAVRQISEHYKLGTPIVLNLLESIIVNDRFTILTNALAEQKNFSQEPPSTEEQSSEENAEG